MLALPNSNILLIMALTLLSKTIFSQEQDSTTSKKFTNFFGSDCPQHTVIEEVRANEQCVLYATEYKLCRIKNNKIRWTLDLNEFRLSDNCPSCNHVCMVVFHSAPPLKRKRTVCILGYDKDFIEVGRMIVSFPSGRVVAKRLNE